METAGTTLRSLTESFSMILPASCEACGSNGAAASERSAQMAVAIRVTAITCRAFLIYYTLPTHFNPPPLVIRGRAGVGAFGLKSTNC